MPEKVNFAFDNFLIATIKVVDRLTVKEIKLLVPYGSNHHTSTKPFRFWKRNFRKHLSIVRRKQVAVNVEHFEPKLTKNKFKSRPQAKLRDLKNG